MEDRYSISLGVDKNTLRLEFITLCLLDGSTPFVILRNEYFGGGRFGGECEVCIELAGMVVVTLGKVIVEYFIVGLVDPDQPVDLVCGENGLVDLDPFNLSQVGVRNEAVV